MFLKVATFIYKLYTDMTLFKFVIKIQQSKTIEGGPQNLRQLNCNFTTISSHFLAIFINIFHEKEVQTVILRCWTGLYLNWFKSYVTKRSGIKIRVRTYGGSCLQQNSDARRWKALRGPVVIGGDNLPSPVRKGLTDLPIRFRHHWGAFTYDNDLESEWCEIIQPNPTNQMRQLLI